jgi:tetratricopeptide (TPR) repeat protein
MRYLAGLFTIMFLFHTLCADAQADVTIRKKDFRKGNQGFDEAWKHVTSGDSYYSRKGVWYGNAYEEYSKAISYNNSNAELNYKIGVAALLSDNKEKAASFLLKAADLKENVTDDISLITARALQYAGKFPDAIEMFEKYLSSQVKKSNEEIVKIKKCIDECNSAIAIIKDTLGITIDNLGGAVNSGSDDYSEILTTDGKIMYFASRREVGKSNKPNSDTKYDENIFITTKNTGTWSPAVPANKNLTSENCEAPLYITTSGDLLYIYAGYENGGDIKKVEINKRGEWKLPDPVDYSVNTSGSETSFCFTPSGNEIYFVTNNGKDGKGGKDIYFIKKLNDKKWSKPQNAGDVINTSFDEESVRFSITGDTIFFSSKGHNSIGGFDIFYSVKNSIGQWAEVKNYGYPVNTQWDDLFYFPSPDNKNTFFFVSNRSGGLGGLDIYRATVKPASHSLPEVTTVPSPTDNAAASDTSVVTKKTEVHLPVNAAEIRSVNDDSDLIRIEIIQEIGKEYLNTKIKNSDNRQTFSGNKLFALHN